MTGTEDVKRGVRELVDREWKKGTMSYFQSVKKPSGYAGPAGGMMAYAMMATEIRFTEAADYGWQSPDQKVIGRAVRLG